jgi:hypothetical protein
LSSVCRSLCTRIEIGSRRLTAFCQVCQRRRGTLAPEHRVTRNSRRPDAVAGTSLRRRFTWIRSAFGRFIRRHIDDRRVGSDDVVEHQLQPHESFNLFVVGDRCAEPDFDVGTRRVGQREAEV